MGCRWGLWPQLGCLSTHAENVELGGMVDLQLAWQHLEEVKWSPVVDLKILSSFYSVVKMP